MSKRAKQKAKLLHKKTLSSDEAVRLLELDGWEKDPDNPQEGSHKHLWSRKFSSRIPKTTSFSKRAYRGISLPH